MRKVSLQPLPSIRVRRKAIRTLKSLLIRLRGYLVEYHDGTELSTLLGETYVCANHQTVLV